ncbi:MAG TPA: dTMP kinase [Clostridiaceae bacterium]|nr:dTMP kinase [Clostridiaceae bacterium]
MDSNGKFISFEGIDGSGKTTQIRLLKDRLQACEIPVLMIREPGGTAVSEAIRDVLLDPSHVMMCAETELLLFAAARAQLTREVIKPALRAGTWVICDRFTDSTVAYQGFGRGFDPTKIERLNALATDGLAPERTFLITLSTAVCAERMDRRGEGTKNRLDQESRAFMNRVQKGYLTIAEQAADRVVVLDGNRSPKVIADEIFNVIRKEFME